MGNLVGFFSKNTTQNDDRTTILCGDIQDQKHRTPKSDQNKISRCPELIRGYNHLDGNSREIDKAANKKLVERILTRFIVVQRLQIVTPQVNPEDPYGSAPQEWEEDLKELTRKRPTRYILQCWKAKTFKISDLACAKFLL